MFRFLKSQKYPKSRAIFDTPINTKIIKSLSGLPRKITTDFRKNKYKEVITKHGINTRFHIYEDTPTKYLR
jgi:hypothetical protein